MTVLCLLRIPPAASIIPIMAGWLLFMGMALTLCGCHTSSTGPLLIFTDTVTLSNGTVRIGVAPSVGRIVDFGRVGSANRLWINRQEAIDRAMASDTSQWLNYGGDRIWPTQELVLALANGVSFSSSAYDGSPWTLVEQSEQRLVMRSADYPNLGIRIERGIELKDDGTVVITNRIERYQDNPVPCMVWSITQLPQPEFCLLGLWPTQPFPERPLTCWSPDVKARVIARGKAARLDWAPGQKIKAGAFGSWVAGVYSDVILLQVMDDDAKACYPDCATVEVYRCPDYVELETLGGSRHLKAGERMENTVRWLLVARPPGRTDDALVEFLDRKIVYGGMSAANGDL